MIYLTSQPRRSLEGTVYVQRSSRGKPLPQPVVVPTSVLCQRTDVGTLLTPAGGDRSRSLCVTAGPWAADTGCFKHPEAFDLAAYLAWLEPLRSYRAPCLFVTAPDRVGDAATTWTVAAPVLPVLRAAGWPAALVAQDGLEYLDVDWSAFDCLFVGGTTGWKLSQAAEGLVTAARQRGKWTHLGRVNSLRRLRAAQQVGYDSADGTTLAYNPGQYCQEIPRWLEQLQRQPALPLLGVGA